MAAPRSRAAPRAAGAAPARPNRILASVAVCGRREVEVTSAKQSHILDSSSHLLKTAAVPGEEEPTGRSDPDLEA
jgi:hypothetical protein